jgi:tetratricopeptide (TPR) repeat protein
LGQIEDGLKDLERGIMTRGSLKSYSSGLVAAWAEGLLLTGAVKDARRQAEQALKSARETGERSVEAEVLHLLGEIAVAEADLEEAVARLQDAIGLATELGMRPLVAHCHLGLGKLYRRTDKREQAHEHLTTATTMYREMGMTYWLEKAEVEMKGLA